jgi:hypothetical protein
MAGGTFVAQNKVRPGCYMNFVAVPAPASNLGTRGIAALPLPMIWGPSYVELLSTDLLDGQSLAKIGLEGVDAEALVFRLALSNAFKLCIARSDAGGNEAEATLKENTGTVEDPVWVNRMVVTARHAGTLGNRLSLIVAAVSGTSKFDVRTNLDGITKNLQRVEGIYELVDNDWVSFEASDPEDDTLCETAGLELSGGTNGTEDSTSLAAAINTLRSKSWNTMGVMSSDSTVKSAASAAVRNMRDVEGRKVQLVLLDAGGVSGENYEGIITSKQGLVMEDGTTVTAAQFIAYLTGLCAGSTITQSNTYHVIRGAKSVSGVPTTHEDIVEALKTGYVVLSYRSDGAVIIEQDINTLCDYPADRSYAFSKNRVMRTLDEIANTIALTWERTYIGKVNNNATGRDLFRSDVINFFKLLQALGAIQNFENDDVEVIAGAQLDAVVCNVRVHPVDSMEKLYMTVNVAG